jgi:hypothetical protein
VFISQNNIYSILYTVCIYVDDIEVLNTVSEADAGTEAWP